MAGKRPDMVALSDNMKDALRLINRSFQLDWDGVLITRGEKNVADRIQLLRDCEIAYYQQNLPTALLSINERYEIDKKQKLADAIARRVLKEEIKASTSIKETAHLKSQVTMAL